MNLLINIHKDSPDVVVFYLEGKNITRTTMDKEELHDLIAGFSQ